MSSLPTSTRADAPDPAQSGGGLRDLLPRIASAIVMIALALGTLVRGGDLFVLFWLLAGVGVFWEFERLIGGVRPVLRFLVGASALGISGALTRQSGQLDLLMLILLAAGGVLAWLAGPGKRIWAAAGLAYAASLVVSVVLLRFSLFEGLESILFLFGVVWGTDIFAYFGGRLIGGPKLWPRISPKKTWSGFLVGVSCGALLGLLSVAVTSGLGRRTIVPIFLMGLACAVLAQAGDLFESAIKRHFGAKDSSHLIPGHGGLMDRLDGFIVAAALAALVGYLRSGPAAVAIGVLRW